MSDSQAQQPRTVAPPGYKLALLTWAGAYAVITLILAVLGPAMQSWPLPLRTLLLSVLMVVALTWLVMPSLTRLFRVWLVRSTHSEGPSSPPRDRDRVRSADAMVSTAPGGATNSILVGHAGTSRRSQT